MSKTLGQFYFLTGRRLKQRDVHAALYVKINSVYLDIIVNNVKHDGFVTVTFNTGCVTFTIETFLHKIFIKCAASLYLSETQLNIFCKHCISSIVLITTVFVKVDAKNE